MGRLNLSNIETEEVLTLDELIPVYAENKADLDKIKKVCDNQNTEIKNHMKELGEDEYTAGGYTAKYIVSERESLNEVRLLDMLKKHNIEGVIKTREYVDMDAFENYLYNNELPDDTAADLASCREVKQVVQLRISKEKKKKKEDN